MLTGLSMIKVPSTISTTLQLLREEIKSRTFILSLEKAGLTSDYDGTNLVQLIFSLMDFPKPTDELMEWYVEKLDHYVEKCELNNQELLNESAFSFYIDFEIKKRAMTL